MDPVRHHFDFESISLAALKPAELLQLEAAIGV